MKWTRYIAISAIVAIGTIPMTAGSAEAVKVCGINPSTGRFGCVEVAGPGGPFANPPAVQDDRCQKAAKALLDSDPTAVTYPILMRKGSDLYQTANLRITSPDDTAPVGDVDYFASFNGAVPLANKTIQTHQFWDGWCVNAAGEADPNSYQSAWVRMVSAANLLAPLFVEVRGQMTPMTPSWPTVSPKHNWQMVKVPLEIRGAVPAPISKSASASNVTGTVSVSITATPTQVIFSPGDPDDTKQRAVKCSIEAMSWDVPDPEHPTACSYTYRHSSVQRKSQPFKTETATVWSIDASDPSINGDFLMRVKRDLLVAETQALVTG